MLLKVNHWYRIDRKIYDHGSPLYGEGFELSHEETANLWAYFVETDPDFVAECLPHNPDVLAAQIAHFLAHTDDPARPQKKAALCYVQTAGYFDTISGKGRE